MDRDTLVQAILDLEHDRDEAVPDPELAYELAHHVKDRIDRLALLRNGDGEVAVDFDDDIGSLGAEAEAVAGGEERPRSKPRKRKAKTPLEKGPPEGPVPTLLSIPPLEQARWIFMERFFPLEKHEEVLELSFGTDLFAQYQQSFDDFFKNLLLLPKTIEAIERNDVQALQRTFAAHVILFRSPFMGDDTGESIPCSFEALRERFPSYFFRKKKKSWYQRHDFFQEPIAEPRWVLCDTEYLNCTLRRPSRKLGSYAKDWDLPSECIGHKSVIEDVYDRIVCGEILEEDMFARNCSSITSTTYRARKKAPPRLVYTVQRVHKIAIHGKAGIPHWKAKRRLWPGAFPAMSFPPP